MSHPTKLIKVLTPIALAISLAACGGGGSFGKDNGGGGDDGKDPGGVTVSSIQLSANSEIGSDGSVPVILKAIAKDQSNAIEGANIDFFVYSDAGATALDSNATISHKTVNGAIVSAELTPGSAENRSLYVRAKSGDYLSDIRQVKVVGTTVVIDGPEAIGFSAQAPFLLKLKNSANQPITGADVVLTSSNNNQISGTNYTTDGNGEIAFNLRATNSGNDVLTADVLGSSYNKLVAISPDEFTLSGSNQDIIINTTETINFNWKLSGNANPSQEVFVSSTRGILHDASGASISKVTTDASGNASFTITSPRAGEAVITATSVANGLSTSMTREFVATTPKYLNSQADPSLIPLNGTSTIVAKVSDVDGNPVKNKVVSFNVFEGAGDLSASEAVTNSLGRATVSYTATNTSSGENGIKIRTYLQGNSTVPDDLINLTVGGEATRLVLGHDHKIATQGVNYVKEFSVFVTDNAGQPVAGKQVSLSIKPTHYYKGQMYPTLDGWAQGKAAYRDASDNILLPIDPNTGRLIPPTECAAEDINNDGVLNDGEDDNINGTLEPTHDANVTLITSNVSDANGEVKLKVVYPKNTALWSKQQLTASIQSEGTEFVEHTSFILPLAAADAKGDAGVPNYLSPYGDRGHTCDDPN